MQQTDYDVIIIGGGMVGLSCAMALAKSGFTIQIIEANEQKFSLPNKNEPFDTKVVAITRASEIFLSQLGIWPIIQTARYCAYDHMKVWDATCDGKIIFSALDLFEENLGHIVEHRVIMAALLDSVLKTPEISLKQGIKPLEIIQDEHNITLRLVNNETISTKLIIGADGVNSFLRKHCAIGAVQQDYDQHAIVATIQGTQTHQHTAWQRFAPEGPLALLPLADPHQCSIVWTTTPRQASKLMVMDTVQFNETLTRESDYILGNLKLLSQRYSFVLKSMHAKHYAIERCVLVGDAAHSLHPLAGQGVNLGFADVIALVNTIHKARTKHKDYGTLATLKKYERACKLHNQMMISMMSLFKHAFGSKNSLIQGLRNIGLNWTNDRPFIKQLFVKVAMGTLSSHKLNIL